MDADVLIVGGGLNGPVLALALAKGGLSSAVVDARPRSARAEQGFDGRAYALSLASQRLLAAIDVWQGLTAQPILKVVASDGRPFRRIWTPEDITPALAARAPLRGLCLEGESAALSARFPALRVVDRQAGWVHWATPAAAP